MCALSGVNHRRSEFSSGGERIPIHVSDLDWCPLWGLSFPVPFLLMYFLFLLHPHLFSDLYGFMALLRTVGSSAGGGVFGFVPLLPPSPFLLCPNCRFFPSSLCRFVPWLLRFVEPVVFGLPGIGHYVVHFPAGS